MLLRTSLAPQSLEAGPPAQKAQLLHFFAEFIFCRTLVYQSTQTRLHLCVYTLQALSELAQSEMTVSGLATELTGLVSNLTAKQQSCCQIDRW